MQEIFEGLRELNELHDDGDKLSVSLDHRDLECLDAATLLHSIGVYTGKKGYHKQSYRVIMVCAFTVLCHMCLLVGGIHRIFFDCVGQCI